MNKFLPQTGGHSLHLDEFILMQNAYFDGFKALVNKIAPSGNMIIDGFVVDQTGPSVVYTSGYITFNGEIFKVDSGSFTKDNTKLLYLKPVETAIAPSPITYEDTAAKNVHLQRKAILKYWDGTESDGINYNSLSYPGSVIEGSIMCWVPPTGTVVTDFFDTTGKGIGKALGYAICNGLNNTLDLRGMNMAMATTVPFSGGSAPLRAILAGTTAQAFDEAGRNLVVLTKAQMPSYALTLTVNDPGHFHTEVGPGAIGNHAGGSAGFDRPNGTQTNNTGTKVTGITVSGNSGGSDQGHENRQATIYVYYITRIQ